jgi:multidrug efflux pump
MTSLATVAGAFPLIISSGAGAESRETIGVVIVFGVLVSTALTLLVVPVAYELLARWTGSPEARAREIEAWESVHGTGADGGLEPVRPRPANAPIPPQAAE